VPHGSSIHSQLAEDVRRGLGARPRSLPPKWFYDARGSELFDRICELPEYYLTRAERSILERDAAAIIAASGASELLEIGSGFARKTGLLLQAMAARGPVRYLPFDISTDALEASARSLRSVVPQLIIDPIVGDFERDVASVPRGRAPRMWAFLGSTIGNLDEEQAPAVLSAFASRMKRDDTFLLGVDLVKDVEVLERAYDDAEGVTALFNKNVLTVINRELEADFDVNAFEHRAHFNVARARIEMHLESQITQTVRIAALGLRLTFDRGERILTEISRKFTRETTERTLGSAGLSMRQWFAGDGFALALSELSS
jgi:L-histidine Nalpha-methyltransferase